MLTWAVTIPVFWVVTLRNLRDGVIPASDGVTRVARTLLEWVVVITIACYAVVILLAQAQMNAIPRVMIDLQNLF
jgi:hypothetical protein